MKVFRINTEFRILGIKMLNSADKNSFSDLVSVYLKVLTIKLGIFNILKAYSKLKILMF